jgi:hypothetical protein
MSYDLNDAQPQMAPIGELIPDGTFAKVRLTIRPGGVNGATPMDAGLLKASQSSDARMLDCEFTVVEGPHARRKFWQSFTVAGGKLDEKGQSIGWKISKSTFRAMVDSALGLDPRDETPATKAKRVLPGLKHLDGIVVLPDEPQHTAVMRGETVPPEPVNAPPRKAASVAAPGWQAPTPAWGAATQPTATAAPTWGAQTGPAAPATPQTPAPAAPGTPAMPAWLNG